MFDVKNLVMVGANATVQKIVEEADTAAYYGTGTLGRLVATPAVIALMIKAAVNVVDDRLPPGFVSIGRSEEFVHEAPCCLGMSLRVKATLKEFDGDLLVFDIVACDNIGVIGHGKHVRSIVNLDKLLERSNERCFGRV